MSEGSSTPSAPVTAVPWGNNIALFDFDRNGGIYTASGNPNYDADVGNFAGFGPWAFVSDGLTGAPAQRRPPGYAFNNAEAYLRRERSQ
jgi:hypothetical protein